MTWFSTTPVNPDLQKFRSRATFNVEKLTYLLYNGKAEVEKRRTMYHTIKKEIEKLQNVPINLIARPKLYEEGLRRNFVMVKILKKHPEWDNFADKLILSRFIFQYSFSPLIVHESMFTDLVENQITDDQKKMWMDDIKNYTIIGTYAQTELGHGTNVQALETTATYDPTREEFVINSPTLTSTKFWPGGLGKTANHVAVMAQLITKGKRCGVHPFMVQIRDKETNVPLKGITVGDIGPKFGWNSIDNGFLRFDNVRIPRINMLMKYFEICKDGTFKKTSNQSKTVYGTLVYTRVLCVQYYGGRMVGMAATVASRYGCVTPPRCFTRNTKKSLLDTKHFQETLLSSFSTCYAIWFAGSELINWYWKIYPDIIAGDVTFLPELHAVSSGMKALSTNKALEEIEKCRQLCGSNGYLLASALPRFYDQVSPGVTIDGDNTVLYLQLARYLIKVINGIHKVGETTIHLQRREWTNSDLDSELKLESLVEAHHYLSSSLLNEVNNRLIRLVQNGLNKHEAWNKSSVDLIKAAEAFSLKYTADSFFNVVKSIEDARLKMTMSNLLRHFAIGNIINNKVTFLQDGYMTPEMMELLEKTKLMEELLPNVVAFGDSFDHSDIELDSCIGSYDGEVLERTMATTTTTGALEVDETVRELLKELKNSRRTPSKL